MKKIILIYLFFIFSIFLLPAIFTKKNVATAEKINDTENTNEQEKEIKLSEYTYKEYNKIKLLHNKTGEIEELTLDEYLLGVVSAEMPANYEIEALKAQAVVARTYTIYSIVHNKNKHEEADICDNSGCCQAWISKIDRMEKWEENNRINYWNKIVYAVDSTKGKIITYNGEVIDAFFHSNSGGTTETPVNVWGGTNYPYLQSVQTSGEDAYSQYSSEVILDQNEFINKIREKYSNLQIDLNDNDQLKITEYTESGRVKTVKVGNINISGVEMRTTIGLKSTNFEITKDGEKIIFNVKGYGHGVGMSQTGADSMAKQGINYEEIIKHFYTNVQITDI